MEILQGTSNDYCVLAQTAPTETDLQALSAHIGSEVSADEVAIVEAVAFSSARNSNGWQIADIDKVETIGASLNYDHSENQRDAFGVIFSERKEGDTKIVKAAIPKTWKSLDAIADLKFKVARYTSPKIVVGEWQDKPKKIVGSGRMISLSLVESPAYGTTNKVLSLAAEAETEPQTTLTAQDQALLTLGQSVHSGNVTKLVRLQELKAGGYSKEVRDQKTQEYLTASPSMVCEMTLLAEAASKPQGTTQQSVSVSESPRAPETKKPVNPMFSPREEYSAHPSTQFAKPTI